MSPPRARLRRVALVAAAVLVLGTAAAACSCESGVPTAEVVSLKATPNPLQCVPPKHEGDTVLFKYTVTYEFNDYTREGTANDPNRYPGPYGGASGLDHRHGSYSEDVFCHDTSFTITVTAFGYLDNPGQDSKTITVVVKPCQPNADGVCPTQNAGGG